MTKLAEVLLPSRAPAAGELQLALDGSRAINRASLLRGALVGATGLLAAGAFSSEAFAQSDSGSEAVDSDAAKKRVLLAYFSRSGENYYYGGRRDLKTGNTKVLAELIARSTGADVHEIRASKPYSTNYQAAVDRNVREQNTDARPRIANPLKSIDAYDIVLVGSPIWNVRPPMIMSTFADSYDFSGKTIYPFVTYAVSGLGSTLDVYAEAFPGATIGKALAVQGEKVGAASGAVESWLRRINLVRKEVSHGR